MQKVYFISDSHLGVPDHVSSLYRERMMVQWLDMVSADAMAIYLLGDIFDFWFEYSHVVPKGYVRLLGKLAELSDRKIPIYYFTGNHDLWAFNYFERELGLTICRAPREVTYHGRVLYVGHGDGLGPGDHGYKLLKRLFVSRVAQKMFALIHPGLGTRLALYWSKKSRIAQGQSDKVFLGLERESLVAHCRDVLLNKPVDYFIFGHRHFPIHIEIAPGAYYVNTGDWVTFFSYVELDEGNIFLKRFVPASVS